MKIIITGGAGFIGSALIRYLINETNDEVVNLDKLTYAGNLAAVENEAISTRYFFEHGDICDFEFVTDVLKRHRPDAVMHLAAESHVDNSIKGPGEFVITNVVGTFELLEAVRAYWATLEGDSARRFRFLHVSTDEVFGDLALDAPRFSERTPYAPSSPYSATKAASDHLVRAWGRTYELPVMITSCSNNYGPYQFIEKLIPKTITNALAGEPIPIYGEGLQIRDWLHVDDHARALIRVLKSGKVGESYAIGGDSEKTNIEVVTAICNILDEMVPKPGASYVDLIAHVDDRPGHDYRYAIDSTKIREELSWTPTYTFEIGILETVKWYLHANGGVDTRIHEPNTGTL